MSLSHADILEPDGNRLAVRGRVHHHARVSPLAVAVLACGITLAMALRFTAAGEHRSYAAKREFQREHPCPSTGRTSGACPGYVKDHIKPLACRGPDTAANLQWQTIQAARVKDKWERKSCAR